jgi:hypothetical protein
VRAEPPPPHRRRKADPDAPLRIRTGPRRRCPYLEQILKERAGPFGWLTRYKADCQEEDRHISRYTD